MKVAFFSFFSGIREHSVPESALMKALSTVDAEVVTVRCKGFLAPSCHLIDEAMMGSPERIAERCATCIAAGEDNLSFSGARSVWLDGKLPAAEESLVRRDSEMFRDQSNPLDFKLDGFPLGLFAMYDPTLKYKWAGHEIIEPVRSMHHSLVLKSIVVYHSFRLFLEREKPDRVVMYNPAYSINRAAAAACDSKNVRWFTIHAGNEISRRLEKLVIHEGLDSAVKVAESTEAVASIDTPLEVRNIRGITRHVSGLLRASTVWVYSKAGGKDGSQAIRNSFRLGKSNRVILALGASLDERNAIQFAGVDVSPSEPIFESHLDWIRFLVSWCKNNPSVDVIYRPHPRQFPNRRENLLGQAAIELQDFFSRANLPTNFKINWPSDELALYDLLKVCNLVANSTSSSGLEAMLFGINVLGNGSRILSYPSRLQSEPVSEENYQDLLANLSNTRLQASNVIRAHRWLQFRLYEAEIDISSFVKQADKAVDSLRRLVSGRNRSAINFRKSIGDVPNGILSKMVAPILAGEDLSLKSEIHADKLDSNASDWERRSVATSFWAYSRLVVTSGDAEFQSRRRALRQKIMTEALT